MGRRNVIRAGLGVALLACMSGCAFTPQQATLAPAVNIVTSAEGKGVPVALRVVDERSSKSLGRRGTAYGAAAEITSAQDVAVIVQQQMIDGLKKKGFEPLDYDEGKSPRMTVEIRMLEYSTAQGFWTGGVQIQGAMKAIASKNGKMYEHMYRSEKKERVVVVPTAKTNEQWINSALSDVLNQLFEDSGLFTFLAN